MPKILIKTKKPGTSYFEAYKIIDTSGINESITFEIKDDQSDNIITQFIHDGATGINKSTFNLKVNVVVSTQNGNAVAAITVSSLDAE